MYERFTDRARKIMQLANQEAQRFNHECIGTEHILLGFVKEGGGVGSNVLRNLNVDLRKITIAVEKLIQPGPDTIGIGRLPQTPSAKKVIEYAIDEARHFNHNYVGSEHILLGLLRVPTGVAYDVLTNLGLTLDAVRKGIIELLGHNKTTYNVSSAYPFTPAFPKAGTPIVDAVDTEPSVCQVNIDDIFSEFKEASKTGPLAENKVLEFLQMAAQRGWIAGRNEGKGETAQWTGIIHGGGVMLTEFVELKNRVAKLEEQSGLRFG